MLVLCTTDDSSFTFLSSVVFLPPFSGIVAVDVAVAVAVAIAAIFFCLLDLVAKVVLPPPPPLLVGIVEDIIDVEFPGNRVVVALVFSPLAVAVVITSIVATVATVATVGTMT